MKKKLIRLTESDLHYIVKEALRKAFNGYTWKIDLSDLFGDYVYYAIEKITDTNKKEILNDIDGYFYNSDAGRKLFNKLSNLDVAIDASYRNVGENPYDYSKQLYADRAELFDEDKQELINIINSYNGENISNVNPNDIQDYKNILISSLDAAIANYDDFYDFEEYYNNN